MAEEDATGQQPITEAQPSGEQAKPGAQDYITRIRTDPDFAEKEVRNLKGRYDKTDASLQKLHNSLGKARDLLETGKIHGDQLLNGYNAFQSLTYDPATDGLSPMGEVIAKYSQTGQLPVFPGEKPRGKSNGSGDMDNDADEWVDPDVKALRDELAGVKGELKQAMERLGHTESSFGKSALSTHFSQVASEIPGMTDGIFDRVKSEVGDELDKLDARARKGDAAALQTMQQLTGASGKEQVKRLFRSRLTDDDWEEIVSQRGLRKQQRLSALSTGGPGTSVEPDQVLDPKAFKGDWRSALEQARMNPERNQSQ